MNYVLQLNAFCEKAIGTLDAKEQAMYLRLFYIANRLGWPEWFEVANSQLMRELRIKSKMTIIAIRKSLTEKGFIQSTDPGHRRKMLYRLVPLTESDKGIKNRPLNSNMGIKNVPLESKNYTLNGQKLYPTININDKQVSSSSSKAPPPIEENSELVDVLHSYQQEISNRPMCSPIETDALQKGIALFGKEKVLEAIKLAVLQNKKKLSYIQGIFNRWEQFGYDEPNEKRGRKQYAGNHRNSGNRQQTRRGNAEPETSESLQRLIDDMEQQDRDHVYPWDIPDDDSGGSQSSS